MPYIGGDVLEITYNHETLGSGTIFCKGNEDGTVMIGGYQSNDDANSVTGDGRFIDQINAVRGSFESPPIAWDMTDQDELSKLVDLAESPILSDWTINLKNGKIWGGRGKPVGDIQGATNTSLVTLKLAFEGRMKSLS